MVGISNELLSQSELLEINSNTCKYDQYNSTSESNSHIKIQVDNIEAFEIQHSQISRIFRRDKVSRRSQGNVIRGGTKKKPLRKEAGQFKWNCRYDEDEDRKWGVALQQPKQCCIM